MRLILERVLFVGFIYSKFKITRGFRRRQAARRFFTNFRGVLFSFPFISERFGGKLEILIFGLQICPQITQIRRMYLYPSPLLL